jgi:hypothetical protein
MPDMYQSSEGLQQSLDDALVKIKQGGMVQGRA